MENISTKNKHLIKRKKIISIFFALITMFSVFTCTVSVWAATDIASDNGWKVKLSNNTAVKEKDRSVSYAPTVTVTDENGKELKDKKDYNVVFLYSSLQRNKFSFDPESVNKVGNYDIRICPISDEYEGYIDEDFDVLPEKVTNLTADSITKTSIDLNWDSLDEYNVVYRVYMYDDESKKYERVADAETACVTINDLSPGQKYQFKVAATMENDGTNIGEYSSVCNVTTESNILIWALGAESIVLIFCIIITIVLKKKKTTNDKK